MSAPGSTRRRIGEVIAALSEEFPEVSVSKVRFLEAEGLISPERAPSGYRLYSGSDIERLRYVLQAQRDRYLPLRVIRDRLAAHDRGLVETDDGTLAPPASAAPAPLPPPAASGGVRLTREELEAAAGIDPGVYDDLVEYGLLDTGADGPAAHDELALAIARAGGALVAAGVEVRHLRPFRSAAEREAGLVEHLLGASRLRGSAAAAAGVDDDSVVDSLGARCAELHLALLHRELDRLGSVPGSTPSRGGERLP